MTRSGLLAREDALNVAHMVERCSVLGPGERFVLWVQGCPLRCPGCHNPQFQPSREAVWLTIDDLEASILSVDGIEGVTYAGGEPFAQPQALAALSRRLRSAGLSVMVYSGFTLGQLLGEAMPHARELLAQADLLLDGPYREDLPTDRPWRGSDNQQLISLTARYEDRVAGWNRPTGQQFEIYLNDDGKFEILGIPPRRKREPTMPEDGGRFGSSGGACNVC